MALDMTIVAYKLKFIVSQFSILTTLAMPPKAGSVKWFNEGKPVHYNKIRYLTHTLSLSVSFPLFLFPAPPLFLSSSLSLSLLAQGRGFITPNDGGPDVFVRHTSVADRGPGRGALREGDDVLFEVTDSPRGPVATSVVKK
ncbi:Cold shock [Rhizoctonia solani]|uniref:Cold shock n=1 Tax=Rhizoctonia solani TaxID=456999 RepID=A0A8H7I3P3_9AGAM